MKDPDGKTYALLDQGAASLVTSPFTVTTMTPVLTLDYKFPAAGVNPNALTIEVLSGPDYAKAT